MRRLRLRDERGLGQQGPRPVGPSGGEVVERPQVFLHRLEGNDQRIVFEGLLGVQGAEELRAIPQLLALDAHLVAFGGGSLGEVGAKRVDPVAQPPE